MYNWSYDFSWRSRDIRMKATPLVNHVTFHLMRGKLYTHSILCVYVCVLLSNGFLHDGQETWLSYVYLLSFSFGYTSNWGENCNCLSKSLHTRFAAKFYIFFKFFLELTLTYLPPSLSSASRAYDSFILTYIHILTYSLVQSEEWIQLDGFSCISIVQTRRNDMTFFNILFKWRIQIILLFNIWKIWIDRLNNFSDSISTEEKRKRYFLSFYPHINHTQTRTNCDRIKPN